MRSWSRRRRSEGVGVALAPGITTPIGVECDHLAIMGPPGSGKTFVITTWVRQAIDRGDRILWLDLKGDGRDRVGGSAYVVGLSSSSTTPLALGRDLLDDLDDIEFTKALIPSGSDQTWAEGARQVLGGMVQIARAFRGNAWDARHLQKLLQMPMNELHQYMVQHAPSAAPFIDPSEEKARTVFSFWVTLLAHIGPPMLALARAHRPGTRSVSLRDWALGNAGTRPLVLAVDLTHRQLSAAIARLALDIIARTMAGDAAAEGHDHRLWCVLDEVARIGPCEAVRTLTALGRSKGVRVVLAPQSPADLRAIYGKDDAAAILENIGVKIVMRVAPGEAAQEVSERWIGRRTVSWYERDQPAGGGQAAARRVKEEVLVMEPVKLSGWLGRQPTPDGEVLRGLLLGTKEIMVLEWPLPD